MDQFCCSNAGGRVVFHVNGKRYPTRGGITLRPTTVERQAGANDDGSLYVTTKAVPGEADFKLSDSCGLRIEDLTEACFVDATIDLIDMKKRYLYTQGRIIGRPEFSSESGEITGLKLVSGIIRPIRYANV